MIDHMVLDRRWHVWPSPAFVLGHTLAASKAAARVRGRLDHPHHRKTGTPWWNQHLAADCAA